MEGRRSFFIGAKSLHHRSSGTTNQTRFHDGRGHTTKRRQARDFVFFLFFYVPFRPLSFLLPRSMIVDGHICVLRCLSEQNTSRHSARDGEMFVGDGVRFYTKDGSNF